MSRDFSFGGWMVLIVAALSIAALPGCGGQAEAIVEGSGDNLLKNGGFEDAGGKAGAGWSIEEAKVAGKGTIARQQAVKSEGNFALEITPSSANANAGDSPIGVGQLVSGKEVQVARLYISGSLGATGGANAVVGVIPLGKNGKPLGQMAIRQSSGDGGMTEHRAELEIARPKDVNNVIVFAVAEGGSGKAYFDDLVLTNRVPDKNKSPDPGLTSKESFDVEIKVEATNVIRTIPRTLFGTNIEWIENGNAILDPRNGEFHKDIVRLTKAAGITLIRYPGGVFSDHFHWKDSIGPRDQRPTRKHIEGAKPESRLLFGTDEAISFAEKVGAELLITVNAGSGSAPEAADWIRYVNHEKKAGVRFWEIGNELYMKALESDIPGFRTKPAEYASLVNEFAKAMREADPNVKLGAIGADNFTTMPLTDHPQWTDEILPKVSGSIDFLSLHNAYAPLVIQNESDSQRVYMGLLAAPSHIRESLAKASRKIEGLKKEDADRITLAVTEWGPFFQVRPDQPYVDHPKTFGSALFVASTLKVFLETPKMEIATFFKLTEPTFMGWIGPRGRGYAAKAPLLAFELFAQHFGEELVASEANAPTFSSPAVGLMPAVTKAPWFEVIAAKRGVDRLFLIGINKHFSSSARANIQLDGFTPKERATVWTLTGKGLDANTGTELPRIPGLRWARQKEVEPWSRMNRGGPGEVSLDSSTREGLAARFEHTFPPMSVTSIEMTKQN